MEEPTDIVLIGFAYVGTPRELKCVTCDLEIVWTWCQTWNCRIQVITDLEADQLGSIVESGRTTLHRVVNFAQWIESLHPMGERVLVYYTGHGEKDLRKENGTEAGILLPDSTVISYNNYNNHIIGHTLPSASIFHILDCCYSEPLNAPYVLQDNSFRLRPIGHNRDHRTYRFTSCQLLIITASSPDYTTNSTQYGSCLTTCLFRLFESIRPVAQTTDRPRFNRNLEHLRQKLNGILAQTYEHHQQINIYASHPLEPILPLWLGPSVEE